MWLAAVGIVFVSSVIALQTGDFLKVWPQRRRQRAVKEVCTFSIALILPLRHPRQESDFLSPSRRPEPHERDSLRFFMVKSK